MRLPCAPRLRFPTWALPIRALIALCTAAAGLAAQDAQPRPNVLLIVADDLNTQLGCYGDPLVKSPHIDRLARRGVLFERAYCQFTACNPSRVSFLTGLYPMQSGMIHNRGHFRRPMPDIVTLPQLFRQNGYYTARVGKVFHAAVPEDIGQSGADDPQSWDDVVNPRGRDRDDEHLIESIDEDKDDFSAVLSWLAADGADAEQTDAIGASALIELMRAHHPGQTGRPFFLALGFYRPHTPFVAPKRYFEMYPREAIQLADDPADDAADIPPAALPIRTKWRAMTEEQQRAVMQAYYASISFVDAQVGRILDALDALDLARHTVVVLFSDHGFSLGQHGLWQKANLFERACRAPLLIAAPMAAASAGRSSAAVTELIDVYPTLAELCAIPAPTHLAGRSLVPILADPSRHGKEVAYSMSVALGAGTGAIGTTFGHSVRGERYRYTAWGDDAELGEELYDHERDPSEHVNVADRAEHRDALLQHRAQLRAILALESHAAWKLPRAAKVAGIAVLFLGALALASLVWVRRTRRRAA